MQVWLNDGLATLNFTVLYCTVSDRSGAEQSRAEQSRAEQSRAGAAEKCEARALGPVVMSVGSPARKRHASTSRVNQASPAKKKRKKEKGEKAKKENKGACLPACPDETKRAQSSPTSQPVPSPHSITSHHTTPTQPNSTVQHHCRSARPASCKRTHTYSGPATTSHTRQRE